jgi:hypothetical protein
MEIDRHELDRAFHFIMETFVSTGHAPHFTEVAKQLGLTPGEGKALLHKVIDTRVMPMWLYPGTDLIVSFAPFNNLPNQYAITVDGQQKWFGQ